jgi:hypothetical protein
MITKLIPSTILMDPEEADKTIYALFSEFIHQAKHALGVKYIPCLSQTSACVPIVHVNSELRHRRSDANEHFSAQTLTMSPSTAAAPLHSPVSTPRQVPASDGRQGLQGHSGC